MPDDISLTDEQKQEVRGQLLAAGMPSALADRLISLAEGTRLRSGFCPHCHRYVKMDSPDSAGQLKAIQMALEYTIGKPVEKQQVDVNIRAIESRRELESLSDAELLQIVEGEWEPLPPAA